MSYQSEAQLEQQLIEQLKGQGYAEIAIPDYDTLTVQEVARLTGYAGSTILRYIGRRYIYAVKICGRYAVSKKSIINYFSTDRAFRTVHKSEWHLNIIGNF